MVVLVFWLRERRNLTLAGGLSLELTVLTAATLVSFLLFFTQQVALYVAAILVLLYIVYLWVSSRAETHKPELMGPAATIGSLHRPRQIAVTVFLFLYAAMVIFLAAEPFVHGLVETGKAFGINEFILIQWLAPLASESPELVVALVFTLRGQAMAAMTTLISAEVSQLTLLIGTMPLIFSISFGQPSHFPLDSHQAVEFLLTSAMSLFAIVLLGRLRIPWYSALLLLGIFASHLFFTGTEERRIFAFIFLGLAAVIMAADLGRLGEMYRRAVAIFHTGNHATETGPASTPRSSD
jgi:cation:H+ antiporter